MGARERERKRERRREIQRLKFRDLLAQRNEKTPMQQLKINFFKQTDQASVRHSKRKYEMFTGVCGEREARKDSNYDTYCFFKKLTCC